MRLVLALFVAAALFGCDSTPGSVNNREKLYDLPLLINKLRVNMVEKGRPVSKSITLNDQHETKVIDLADSAFWSTELAKIAQIDLNSPQLRDALIITKNINDTLSNLQIDEYMLNKKGDIPFKRLRIYYLNEPTNVRLIQVSFMSTNYIAQSTSEIELWVNRYSNKLLIDSLRISGSDKTIFMQQRNYNIDTKTLWQ